MDALCGAQSKVEIALHFAAIRAMDVSRGITAQGKNDEYEYYR
jgi:hypothetical protein